jgi:hypothetical protein
MPVLPSFRFRVLELARQGLGWEDIANKLECAGVARGYVKRIVLGEQDDRLGNTRGDRTGEPHRRHHG